VYLCVLYGYENKQRSSFSFQYLSFPEGHSVAAYVFFLVFPSLISFPLSSIQ